MTQVTRMTQRTHDRTFGTEINEFSWKWQSGRIGWGAKRPYIDREKPYQEFSADGNGDAFTAKRKRPSS